MILYMLDRVSYPLSNSQIVDFFLEKDYTDYFNAQRAVNALTEDGHIKKEEHFRSTLYEITDEGNDALMSLENTLDGTITEEIDSYLKERGYNMRSASAVTADYRLNSSGDYTVSLKITERSDVLLDIKYSVASEQDAEKICDRFRKDPQSYYMEFLKIFSE